jgi:hypothetical protein
MLRGYVILLIIIDSNFSEIVKLGNCLLRVLKKKLKNQTIVSSGYFKSLKEPMDFTTLLVKYRRFQR